MRKGVRADGVGDASRSSRGVHQARRPLLMLSKRRTPQRIVGSAAMASSSLAFLGLEVSASGPRVRSYVSIRRHDSRAAGDAVEPKRLPGSGGVLRRFTGPPCRPRHVHRARVGCCSACATLNRSTFGALVQGQDHQKFGESLCAGFAARPPGGRSTKGVDLSACRALSGVISEVSRPALDTGPDAGVDPRGIPAGPAPAAAPLRRPRLSASAMPPDGVNPRQINKVRIQYGKGKAIIATHPSGTSLSRPPLFEPKRSRRRHGRTQSSRSHEGLGRPLTTFNPSGKLLQIEYALKAVNRGRTSVGIRATTEAISSRRCSKSSSADSWKVAQLQHARRL